MRDELSPSTNSTEPEQVYSVCPHDCPSVCALEVERISPTKIGRVRGSKDNAYTAGVVCAKVARYAERIHNPDRLSQPLKRVGPKGVGLSSFEPISWDEALETVADKIKETVKRSSTEAVWPYYYAGTMGLLQRDGINRFRHEGKFSGQINTICTTLQQSGWHAGIGDRRGVPPLEVAKSDVIVMWGGNPVNTQVNFMTHVSKAKKANGTKFVVVDVYETGTAKQADLFLCVNPSTDGALAAAVAHCLLRDGKIDRKYLAKYSDFDGDVETHYETCTPDWAANICGVPEPKIEEFAALLGDNPKSYFRVGYGFSRSRVGAVAVHAVTCLPTLIGAWQYEGGGALHGNTARYAMNDALIQAPELCDPEIRTLDMSRIGPVLVGDKSDLGDGPNVEAIFIQNMNPMVVAPELAKVQAGFNRDDLFVCVHEQFMTDTAAMADIVLPASMSFEYSDIFIASGHTTLQVTKPVIEPFAEAKSNHWVLCELAKRLGFTHPAFKMTELEIIDSVLETSGYPDAETVNAAKGADPVVSWETDHFLDGFPNKTGKFRFYADWEEVGAEHKGLPKFPGHCELYDKETTEKPFRLVTAPARGFLNSSFTETSKSKQLEGRPTVMIEADVANDMGIADDDVVELANGLGAIKLHAKRVEKQNPKTLVVESLWPNTNFIDGIGINLLVSADPGLPNRGGVFHDTAVSLRKI
ncbi:MAG: molybdopterin-dependent oxidoreductase [Alphaproteobacteria bacterium]